MRRWGGRIWAAWFAFLALTVNALVPVHLAFDLAEVLGPPQCGAHAEGEDAERHVLALVSGHREADGKSHEHHKHHACPVCSTLNALTGFVPPTLIALSVPLLAGLPTTLSVIEGESVGAPAAYYSRAPPLA
jgi:hypothetical protein